LRPYPVPGTAGAEIRWTQPIRSTLRRHSRLFTWLDYAGQVLAARYEWAGLRYGGEPESRLRELVPRGLSPIPALEFLRPHGPDSPWEEAWLTTEALVLDVEREARALGARFLLLVIPASHQVEHTARDRALDRRVQRLDPLGLDGLHDWNAPEARLAEFVAEHGLEAVLLLERLRAAAGEGTPTYKADGHLSTLGQSLAGEAVAERLLEAAPRCDPPPTGAPVELP
jgi:hypothetical protein